MNQNPLYNFDYDGLRKLFTEIDGWPERGTWANHYRCILCKFIKSNDKVLQEIDKLSKEYLKKNIDLSSDCPTFLIMLLSIMMTKETIYMISDKSKNHKNEESRIVYNKILSHYKDILCHITNELD